MRANGSRAAPRYSKLERRKTGIGHRQRGGGGGKGRRNVPTPQYASDWYFETMDDHWAGIR